MNAVVSEDGSTEPEWAHGCDRARTSVFFCTDPGPPSETFPFLLSELEGAPHDPL